MHNIDFINLRMHKEGSVQEDEFKQKKIELYREIIDFIDKLKHSKHPNTVCWLLEILHLLTSKFQASSNLSKESRLIKKMDNVLQHLLTQTAKIIQDDEETLADTRNCTLLDIHLSPSVYELLKRFEFITEKH